MGSYIIKIKKLTQSRVFNKGKVINKDKWQLDPLFLFHQSQMFMVLFRSITENS